MLGVWLGEGPLPPLTCDAPANQLASPGQIDLTIVQRQGVDVVVEDEGSVGFQEGDVVGEAQAAIAFPSTVLAPQSDICYRPTNTSGAKGSGVGGGGGVGVGWG